MEPILNVTDLTMDFGGLRAIDGVSMKIHQGEIMALIGPNGVPTARARPRFSIALPEFISRLMAMW